MILLAKNSRVPANDKDFRFGFDFFHDISILFLVGERTLSPRILRFESLGSDIPGRMYLGRSWGVPCHEGELPKYLHGYHPFYSSLLFIAELFIEVFQL